MGQYGHQRSRANWGCAVAVVTISRQYGSGGREVAAQLCELLGYRYFDKDLMSAVAHEVGLSPQEIVDFSEDQHQVSSFLGRVLRRPQPVRQARAWTEDKSGARTQEVVELDARQSITMVRAVIHAAAKQGDVVIVGRGGQVVLQGQPGVLHVRIQAPLEERVLRVSQRDGLTREAARELIAERDRAAQDYLHTFYSIAVGDPTRYHLVLNTGLWNVETATKIIADMLRYLPAAEPVAEARAQMPGSS
jgi:cytidylate kinase